MSPLIGVLVIGLGLAFVLAGAQRLKLPPLVGYLLAGVVWALQSRPVIDQHLTRNCRIGVVLLMFGRGLHFQARRPDGGQATWCPAAALQMAMGNRARCQHGAAGPCRAGDRTNHGGRPPMDGRSQPLQRAAAMTRPGGGRIAIGSAARATTRGFDRIGRRA